MANNVKIKVGIDFKSFDRHLDKLERKVKSKEININTKDMNKSIDQTKKKVKGLGRTIAESFGSFTLWMGISTLFYGIARSVTSSIETVRALDSAMLELRKVTDLTEESYSNFMTTSFELSKELGRTGEEVILATASFARMGYELERATELAKDALMLSNIGDGITVEEGTSSLISTLKGFNLEASESINIIDKFNQISNNFALSVNDVAQATKRSSAVLYDAGNSLDQTLALITSSQGTVQDARKVTNLAA